MRTNSDFTDFSEADLQTISSMAACLSRLSPVNLANRETRLLAYLNAWITAADVRAFDGHAHEAECKRRFAAKLALWREEPSIPDSAGDVSSAPDATVS